MLLRNTVAYFGSLPSLLPALSSVVRYGSDITVTIPVSGKFTDRQRGVYQVRDTHNLGPVVRSGVPLPVSLLRYCRVSGSTPKWAMPLNLATLNLHIIAAMMPLLSGTWDECIAGPRRLSCPA